MTSHRGLQLEDRPGMMGNYIGVHEDCSGYQSWTLTGDFPNRVYLISRQGNQLEDHNGALVLAPEADRDRWRGAWSLQLCSPQEQHSGNTTAVHSEHSEFPAVPGSSSGDLGLGPRKPQKPCTQPHGSYSSVASLGLFTLQANHRVCEVIQRSEILSDAELIDAVRSLSRVPQHIIDQDLHLLSTTNEYNNATVTYGPDENGVLYDITHSATYAGWFWNRSNQVQASATVRHVNDTVDPASPRLDAIQGFRVIAIHPTAPGRGLAVVENNATSLAEAYAALERADAWVRSHLGFNPDPEEAYQLLVSSEDAMNELVRHTLGEPPPYIPPTSAAQSLDSPSAPPLSPRTSTPLSPAQRIKDDRSRREEAAEVEEHECPVCFEVIDEADAAMRCAGTAGRPHYFHAHCLSRWVDSCRGNWAEAKCPVCRGPIELHNERLGDFLNGTAACEALDEPTRGLLFGMLDGIQGKGWSTGITREQVAEGVGIVAGLGWGFYKGNYSAPLFP